MHNMTTRASRAAVMILVAMLATACGNNNEENNTPSPTEDMGMTTPAEDMGETPDDGGDTDMGETTPDMSEEPDMGETTPDMDVDMGVEGPDVPEVEPNDEIDFEEGIDQSTKFDAGQSIGGNITASAAGERGDVDLYSVTLEGGTIFEWSFAQVGEGVTDQGLTSILLDATTGKFARALYSTDGNKRQAFIPADDTYYLMVYDSSDEQESEADIPAHGGPNATYVIENSLIDLTSEEFTAPGSADGDLDDGNVDVYGFQWASELVIEAEVFGEREPSLSDIDSVLYLWDADAGELVSFNDDLNNDTLDSRLSAAGMNGTTYFLIVDNYTYAPSSSYQLAVSAADDSVDAPGALTTAADVTGDISEADAAAEKYDTDYWAITVQPGETVKITTTADADLQPATLIYLNDQGSFSELAFARPVDGASAATISVPSTLDAAVELYVLVTDVRNLLEDDMDTPDYVGGAGFGYSLGAELVTFTTNNITAPAVLTGTLDEIGEFVWFDFATPASSVLLMEANSTFADGDANSDLLLAQLDGDNGVSFFTSPTTYVNTVAGPKTFGVVDTAFQASSLTTPYDYAFNLRIVDMGSVTYTQLADPMTNTSEANATTLTPPVEVSEQTQALDSMNPSYDYYKVALTAGQTLVVLTEEDPSAPVADPNDPNSTPEFADTIIRLLDEGGNDLVVNDDLLGDDQSTFSAASYTAQADGTVTIVVEPYYSEFFGDFSNGHYLLRVLVEQ